MWRCKFCETLNEGEICAVCGKTRKESLEAVGERHDETKISEKRDKKVKRKESVTKTQKVRTKWEIAVDGIAVLNIFLIFLTRWSGGGLKVGILDVLFNTEKYKVILLSDGVSVIEVIGIFLIIFLIVCPIVLKLKASEIKQRSVWILVQNFPFLYVTACCIGIMLNCSKIKIHPPAFAWLVPELMIAQAFCLNKIYRTNYIEQKNIF